MVKEQMIDLIKVVNLISHPYQPRPTRSIFFLLVFPFSLKLVESFHVNLGKET